MENTEFTISQYIEKKIKGYEPGPQPANGPYPFSKQKYMAALWRALTRKTLAGIAEKTGIPHNTLLQWSRQKRFRETIQVARQEFAEQLVEVIQNLYIEQATEFQARFNKWIESDSRDTSPDPRGVNLNGFQNLPEALKAEILEEATLQLLKLEGATKETEVLFWATATMMEDLQSTFYPKEESKGKSAQEVIRFINILSKCFLSPVLENTSLGTREKNGLRLLSEIVGRFAKENVTES